MKLSSIQRFTVNRSIARRRSYRCRWMIRRSLFFDYVRKEYRQVEKIGRFFLCKSLSLTESQSKFGINCRLVEMIKINAENRKISYQYREYWKIWWEFKFESEFLGRIIGWLKDFNTCGWFVEIEEIFLNINEEIGSSWYRNNVNSSKENEVSDY